MNSLLFTEDIDVYAEDSNKQKPITANYVTGVRVNWTAPAKWWNWFMHFFTQNVLNFKQDTNGIRAEISEALQTTNLVPVDNATHQLSNSLNHIAYTSVKSSDKVPYVDNHKLVLPVDELMP